jgi:hypothetical protein
MKTTDYIFVDYENVHEVDLDLIEHKTVVVLIILGERHKSLPLKMVRQIQKFSTQVRLIEAGRSGRNALDFVLAYHVGVESSRDPAGIVHVVSRDTGFDALIEHLQKNQISARRHESFAQAFSSTVPDPTSHGSRVELITARLTKNKKSRPARKKTLLSQINAHFKKLLPKEEVERIFDALVADKVIAVTQKGGVIYKV